MDQFTSFQIFQDLRVNLIEESIMNLEDCIWDLLKDIFEEENFGK
jgi:hypothetical protein